MLQPYNVYNLGLDQYKKHCLEKPSLPPANTCIIADILSTAAYLNYSEPIILNLRNLNKLKITSCNKYCYRILT